MVSLAIAVLYATLGAPPASDAPGRAEFEEALGYFAAEEYEEARVFFQKAYLLSGGRPSALKGMAQCERALRRYEPAIQLFEEYLRTRPPDAARVRKTVALLRRQAARQADPHANRRPGTGTATIALHPDPSSSIGADPLEVEDVQSWTGEVPRVVVPDARSVLHPEGAAPAPEQQSSIFSSPLLWIAVGLVAVAGGVTVGVLANSGGEDQYGGNTDVVFGP